MRPAPARGLLCLDMDRVLVNHLSTWQVVYDAIGADNSESFNLYNQGKLDEWTWIKLDLRLIEAAFEAMDGSHARVDRLDDILLEAPFMPGLDALIQTALDAGWKVAIVSGGVQATAHRIAARFSTGTPWARRWGGIEQRYADEAGHGCDTLLDVFTNGWLPRLSGDENGRLRELGRYQVQMTEKEPWCACSNEGTASNEHAPFPLGIRPETSGCSKNPGCPFASTRGTSGRSRSPKWSLRRAICSRSSRPSTHTGCSKVQPPEE